MISDCDCSVVFNQKVVYEFLSGLSKLCTSFCGTISNEYSVQKMLKKFKRIYTGCPLLLSLDKQLDC